MTILVGNAISMSVGMFGRVRQSQIIVYTYNLRLSDP